TANEPSRIPELSLRAKALCQTAMLSPLPNRSAGGPTRAAVGPGVPRPGTGTTPVGHRRGRRPERVRGTHGDRLRACGPRPGGIGPVDNGEGAHRTGRHA